MKIEKVIILVILVLLSIFLSKCITKEKYVCKVKNYYYLVVKKNKKRR